VRARLTRGLRPLATRSVGRGRRRCRGHRGGSLYHPCTIGDAEHQRDHHYRHNDRDAEEDVFQAAGPAAYPLTAMTVTAVPISPPTERNMPRDPVIATTFSGISDRGDGSHDSLCRRETAGVAAVCTGWLVSAGDKHTTSRHVRTRRGRCPPRTHRTRGRRSFAAGRRARSGAPRPAPACRRR
jgi:hypothetical protein